MPASLDDKAELDREATDRRPALLEVIAMTTNSSTRGCGGWQGERKEQHGRSTEERVSLEFGKGFDFCRQRC